MPMCLTRTAIVPRIEEGEQAVGPAAWALLPRLQARVRRREIVLFQQMRLLFVRFRRYYEMVGDDRVLVQHEDVAWIRGGQVGNEELADRVLERIKFIRGDGIFAWHRLLAEGWTVS